MKKVLILTYYWPPSGGAGVQRWMRFVKYLRQFGWEPTVYVPENAEYVVTDITLEAKIPSGIRVLKHPIFEPNNLFAKAAELKREKKDTLYKNQQQKGGKKSLKDKLLWFIRGNFFIPDARFLWIKPSIKYLSSILRKETFDIIVSSGPPHSLHLIAEQLKKQFSIPWVADFRDPWTSMDYLQEMYLTQFAKKKHQKLEERVIRGADRVVVVGKAMYNEYKGKYGVETEIIYNGYDEIPSLNKSIKSDEKFTIVHIGSFLKNRNCNDLWQVLSEMAKLDRLFAERIEIKLVGKIDSSVIEAIEKYGLNPYLNKIDYLPFEETQSHLLAAQLLLLPIDRIPNAEFVLTGKLFEYLKSGRPLFLIGPKQGDAAILIDYCEAGYCCDFDDITSIRTVLEKCYQLYLKGENTVKSKNIDEFSAEKLTGKLADLLNTLTVR